MGGNKFDYRACCFYGAWYGTAISIFILTIFLLAAGTILYQQNNKENTMPINMVPTECNLQSHSVYKCKDGTWIGTYNRGRVVESPFAGRTTKALAELSVLSYPLNASYPCMCNIALQTIKPECDAWNACVLNVNLTKHLQITGGTYKYGGDVLVAIGSILLVAIVVATILMMVVKGWFACCCKDESGKYAKFVLV